MSIMESESILKMEDDQSKAGETNQLMKAEEDTSPIPLLLLTFLSIII